MIKLWGFKADKLIEELGLLNGETRVPMDVVFERSSVEGRSKLVIHFKKRSQG